MNRWLGWGMIALGLSLSLGGIIPIALTAPPSPRWWLYLFVAGVTIIVWGGAILVPSRWRLLASLFAVLATLWGLLIALGLDWAPAFR
jgi:hypothetical protein